MLNFKALHKKSLQKTSQQVAFVFFLLFTLAPCKVRASFLQSFDIAYSKPFNKTKIANVSSVSCDAQILNFHETQEVKQNSNIKLLITPGFNFSTTEINAKVSFPKKKAILTSGNNPPLYILYKRFKFDVA